MDGARVFNALLVNQLDPKTYGKPFDSISICLSKGLGAPVGSVLLGSKEFIKQARRVRKYLGGGMRQAGIIAAGGLYALKNNVDRLKDDHHNATALENHFNQVTWVKEVLPVETNIVVLILKEASKQVHFIEAFKAEGILVTAFGKGRIRFVTHLNISSDDIKKVCELKFND